MGFRFELRNCEETRGEAGDRHHSVLHGRVTAGQVVAGMPVAVPGREERRLGARIRRVEAPNRLVVAEPAIPRALVRAGADVVDRAVVPVPELTFSSSVSPSRARPTAPRALAQALLDIKQFVSQLSTCPDGRLRA